MKTFINLLKTGYFWTMFISFATMSLALYIELGFTHHVGGWA